MDNEEFFTDNEEVEDGDNSFSGDSDGDISDSGDAVEFNVLSTDDIRRRANQNISEISTLLSLSTSGALLLLCKYGWSVSRVSDEWFSDEAKTRKNCGLVVLDKYDDLICRERGKKRSKSIFFCGICLEEYHEYAVDHRRVTAECGHAFCETCWRTYISTSIQDGPGCLSLNCPQPNCSASIGDMIEKTSLVCSDDKTKYERYVLRSYVESSKYIKWCPSPGCEFAVECLSPGLFGSNYDVTCDCSYKFCWNCSEEIHTPCDCKVVAKWIVKNSSESESTDWILGNTKPCPKCKRSIEKNEGCMHMTCRQPCRFHFCWLCLGPWSEHDSYFRCNRYEEDQKDGKYLSEEDKIRETAKKSSVKYTHYYERWIGNDLSRKKALESMKKLQMSRDFEEKMSELHGLTSFQLKFISDAWGQVVECRRVLKWSYVHGFYLSEAKKEFFEHMQGVAEYHLERLHGFVEVHLPKLIPCTVDEFEEFRRKVLDLTKITRDHFESLAKSLV